MALNTRGLSTSDGRQARKLVRVSDDAIDRFLEELGRHPKRELLQHAEEEARDDVTPESIRRGVSSWEAPEIPWCDGMVEKP
jgi:hypothetical protein